MNRKLPYLGVGLSYRWELNAAILRSQAGIDWLEITPEHFLPLVPEAAARLALLGRRFPLVGHSLELSVGSDGTDEPGYRESLRRVVGGAGCVWHGDHLCFTRAGDRPVRALLPLPLGEAALEVTVRNIRAAAGELSLPFVIENIAYYLTNPLSQMAEPEFLHRVALEADCGLLLDLHNLAVNAANLGFDPYRFVDRLPLDRVVQIHLAGGDEADGLRLDTHSACSPEDVWALLEYVVPRCPVRGVNFEMDGNFPPFARLLEELARARAVLQRHGASGA